MKTTISAVEARKNLGRFLNVVALTNTEVTIERAGKPIARLTGVRSAVAGRGAGSGKLDIRSSRGLGRDLWTSVDVDEYISKERQSWD